MIDTNMIKNNKQIIVDAVSRRGFTFNDEGLLGLALCDGSSIERYIERYFKLDECRRSLMKKVEMLKAERNRVSGEVPKLKKAGEPTDALFERMRAIGTEIEAGDKETEAIAEEINRFLTVLPNIPDDDIVSGGKENNEPIKYFGKKPILSFPCKNHVDLCTSLGLIDYERGVKIGGSGYWMYRGLGAQLEWALLNFFISEHLRDGYEFILPPHQLNYFCGYGAGQFPKFADEVYWLTGETGQGKFMLPTSETALVNIYGNEIMDEGELPKKIFAYTPCYRKEAGSYRASERGMIRGHQFNKVEMIQFTRPQDSRKAFDELVGKACALVEKLGLHYRLTKLAAGDISHSMARTYDIEVWIPSMEIYQEVSSVSCANDYQARRSNTRYRDTSTGKPAFVHTLNGSGLATSRIIPAIVEQYQNADGSVTIPEALRGFIGVDTISK